MRHFAILVTLLAWTGPGAWAQEGIRDSDVMLSKAELTEYLAGQELEFYTGGFGTYRADGRHDYRYSDDGERVPGDYEVMEDSRVCVRFDNGFSRCDYVVRNGDRHLMVIDNGERYPVKARVALQ